MRRNGHTAELRVLLSGPAADAARAGTLEQRAGISVHPARTRRRRVAVDRGRHAARRRVLVGAEFADDVRRAARARRRAAHPRRVRRAERDRRDRPRRRRGRRALLPQPTETLLFALRKAAVAPSGTAAGKVVTVFSPKGGSGKTVLATNLAVAAARSGIETLLVDLDLQFGDSALTLAVTPRATIADLAASSGDDRRRETHGVRQHRPDASDWPCCRRRSARRRLMRRSGRARSRARGGAQRVRGGRHRHRAALRRRHARGARPHRRAAARLQPRGHVAQERPHRSRDDRPARLRPRPHLARRQPRRRSRCSRTQTRSSKRSGAPRSRTSCPTIAAVPAAVNRAVPVVVADENSQFSRALGELGSSASLRRARKPPRQTSAAPAPSERPTMKRVDRNGFSPQRARRCSPSGSRPTAARCRRAREIRTPS